VTVRQGRRRRKLLDDLKERRGYSHLKEEALDRTMWRARFGRGFGPVVRQTVKWMNEHMLHSGIGMVRIEFSRSHRGKHKASWSKQTVEVQRTWVRRIRVQHWGIRATNIRRSAVDGIDTAFGNQIYKDRIFRSRNGWVGLSASFFGSFAPGTNRLDSVMHPRMGQDPVVMLRYNADLLWFISNSVSI
jgi:hypothetical protein